MQNKISKLLLWSIRGFGNLNRPGEEIRVLDNFNASHPGKPFNNPIQLARDPN